MRRQIVFMLVILALSLIAGDANAARRSRLPPHNFTLLASTSLTQAMAEITRLYAVNADTTITTIYNAPDEMTASIIAGDPADLVIMEDSGKIQSLRQQGLLDVSSQATVAANRLDFVTSPQHRLAKHYTQPATFKDFLKNYTELETVMADPASLAPGKAAKQALGKLGYWRKLMPTLVRAGSAKEALYLIARGNRAGVVYHTDTVDNPEVVVLANIPDELHDPIIYHGAVVAGENMDEARKFLKFLSTPEVRGILQKHGFVLPEEPKLPTNNADTILQQLPDAIPAPARAAEKP